MQLLELSPTKSCFYHVTTLRHIVASLKGILESSIKITNEPPTGMLANLHKALDNFTQVHTYYSINLGTSGILKLHLKHSSWLYSHTYIHVVYLGSLWNIVTASQNVDMNKSCYFLASVEHDCNIHL